ncbi:NUDIX hydrolase [Deinococcus budaensis]|uniref:8-oxo-dGTP pyrophosphatase MutT (NUDIX family) n=1 Tax=Deinococcus budaensis TaxID=1665626 RepID=A0A7W8GC69_9DEIO|nr:NUDIX domain-containing protein [Deinococcus budaensis]MBB5232739.1 8-oxo-dGTP pyrophosphatase MutT (NUDIX family) [Deinococcus budaensis]
MTDIRLPLGGVKFSVRVAILCVRDGKLLATSEPGLPFWYLPGGALAVGEDAASGAAREWTEETGLEPGPLHLAGIVESFFGVGAARQHEIGFYFRMEAPAELPAGPFAVLDQTSFPCDWIPLTELASRPVHPLAAHQLLGTPPGTLRHIVNRE